MIDPVEFGKAMGAIVRDAMAPVLKRLDELEVRQAERGEKGDAGPPGRDAEPIDIADIVAELLVSPELKTLLDLQATESVAEYFESNPVRDGKDADHVTDDQIAKAVVAYLSEHPPKNGEDGKSVTAEDVKGIVDLEVAKGLLDLERHAGAVIQRAADAIPKPKDGKDGADFTDVEFDYDGERGLIIRGQGGEIVKRLPIPIDRGYWREGMTAEKADIVTNDGSAWIALKDTKTKPGHDQKDAWRMLARKGKDGDPGKDGKAYKPPEPVKLT